MQRIERLTRDVTEEYELMKAQILLMRVTLKLNPCHDLLACVRILHDEGREAFEKARGEPCDYAHEWQPRYKAIIISNSGCYTAYVTQGIRS